jgi:hypothetical protein
LQLKRTQKAGAEDFILWGVVTVTFRVLSLFVVPTGEYLINLLTNPNPVYESLIRVTIWK